IGYDDSDNPMRYIFMTTNPTKEGDIFTADLKGKIEDKIVRRLYKDTIIRPNALASFDSNLVSNTSTYDDSVTFTIEDKDIPYGIGEYFRYKTLTVYKNDQASVFLNRLNVGVIGYSPNYLYFVSERGLEKLSVK
ncbi:MAG: hypothetical protein QG639_753, partial [Patescibacteria group bacterium]|nr:hypothetical protein [Patescibacteria group bacterium]